MRSLVPFAILTVVAVSCGPGGDANTPEDQTDPITSVSATVSGGDETFELGCEPIFSVHRDFDGAFEGYATQREAAESWAPGRSGLPRGEWKHFDGDRWILVTENGDTVARTRVEVWASNASTTFATERYASGEVEYCE